MDDGFAAYEKLVSSSAGKFSSGDEITMADICLVPAIWRAARCKSLHIRDCLDIHSKTDQLTDVSNSVGVDMEQFPTIKRIFEAMSKEDAVKKAHWQNQPDCPEDLR